MSGILFLSGTAAAPSFILSYILNLNGKHTQISPGQTVTLPTVNVGSSSTTGFQITNQGNVDAASLAPQQSMTFQIQFSPVGAGTVTAQLPIGGVSFPVSATARDRTSP
jgi:hypothetical protein